MIRVSRDEDLGIMIEVEEPDVRVRILLSDHKALGAAIGIMKCAGIKSLNRKANGRVSVVVETKKGEK